MTWHAWLSLIAALLAAAALALAADNRRTLALLRPAPRPGAAPSASTPPTTDRPLVAFIANPTKPGAAELRDQAVQACAARYLPEPLWFETTADDPGVGQTREALEAGAQVVVAAGGDGTVRAVAEGLAGTAVPMALLPQGTGNLLARNLDLPLTDLDAQLRIALTGNDRVIDVAWLTVVRDEKDVRDPVAEADPRAIAPDRTHPAAEDTARRHIFLVMGGVGFDAAMMADADEELKARVGWVAYLFSGARHLHGRRLRLDVRLDDGPWLALRVRSLLVGNCGRLPGGLTLFPEALLDDGELDVGAIDTRGGMLGWGTLFGSVVAQGFGVRANLPGAMGTLDHARTRHLRLRSREPQAVQVDGDVVGSAYELEATVSPRALTVRVA